MKKLAFALAGMGLLLIVISVWADPLGIGGDPGLGGTQRSGILAGAALLLFGIGLWTVKGEDKPVLGERNQLINLSNLPILFWVLAAFLIVYLYFFVEPVFFSGTQIQYLTKYIPDAYVTHIGFDVEAIVSRIEAWLATGQSPYADGFIAYPPLTMALFSGLSIFGYPAYFRLMVMFTVLAYLVAALLLPWFLIPKRNRTLLMLFFITGLFSYGLQFEQERGQFNLIAFSFCLTAIYIFHFHPRFRFFAYLLFTLSIQLKVYPVFFIAMFVDDWRDWRAILKRFLGLALVNFLCLFVLGYRLFLDFLRAITEYQLLESSRVENLSIKGFAYYLSNEVAGSINLVPQGIVEMLLWVILALCFVGVVWIAVSRKWIGLNPYLLMVSTIAALIIPSVSNDYKLSLLIPPMALLVCFLPELAPLGRKTITVSLVILASLAYWTTIYPATVKPEFLARNFPALMLILVSTTALNFLTPNPNERNLQEISGLLKPDHE